MALQLQGTRYLFDGRWLPEHQGRAEVGDGEHGKGEMQRNSR
jgi:hypothetical protein